MKNCYICTMKDNAGKLHKIEFNNYTEYTIDNGAKFPIYCSEFLSCSLLNDGWEFVEIGTGKQAKTEIKNLLWEICDIHGKSPKAAQQIIKATGSLFKNKERGDHIATLKINGQIYKYYLFESVHDIEMSGLVIRSDGATGENTPAGDILYNDLKIAQVVYFNRRYWWAD